ncbi:hypothetical protein D2Q93_05165 [Alicyclobacillaceae bacterium I2511]|nr:hypothetical protein D2Q93_05165 [Alicyclobacillaceae bacterium I2511]
MSVIHKSKTLQQALWRHSETIPDKTFVIYKHQSYSFRAWQEWVDRIAGGFRALGVQAGEPVLLAMENCPEVYATLTALSLFGALPVAVNPLLKVSELQFMVDDLACSVAVADRASRSALTEIAASSGRLRHLVVHESADTSGGVQDPLGSSLSPSGCQTLPFSDLVNRTQAYDIVTDEAGPAIVLYNATASGKPMATLVTQALLVQSWRGLQESLDLTSNEVCISALPNYHIFSIVAEYGQMLWLGGTLVLHDHFQPNTALQHLAQYRGSWMCGVPAMFSVFADIAERTGVDLRAFRYGVIGGAPVDAALLKRWEDLTGGTLLQAYGSTEVAVATLERPNQPRSPGSAGTCLPGCQLRIVDEDGAEVAAGVVGEILIRLAAAQAHYWHRPQAEQAAFRDGWLQMGDLGRLDADGNLYVVGRKKTMILYGGENIYPSEVEPVLQAYPGVAEAVLLGIPTPIKGEEPIVCVRVDPSQTVDAEALLHYAHTLLADYKVPRRVLFMPEFPRAAGGSVRRYELLLQVLQSPEFKARTKSTRLSDPSVRPQSVSPQENHELGDCP